MPLTTEEKINLRVLAEKARDNPSWTHVAYIEALGKFHDAANTTAVLALLDEIDLLKKQVETLKEESTRLKGCANCHYDLVYDDNAEDVCVTCINKSNWTEIRS